jgi:SOS-response transcriptional repressor LexA
MSRGMKGCYVYFCDNDVAEYFQQMMLPVPEKEKAIQKAFVIPMASQEEQYITHLPVYTIKAACGYFEDNSIIPENEEEGWVDIREYGFKANRNMFVVHAAGDSMLPKIKDGDLCVFELYGPNNAGSRNGEIVLTECQSKDTDTDCHYTIKKYHSEFIQNEDGALEHSKIELIPLNKDYDVIELDGETNYRTIGVLKCVIR